MDIKTMNMETVINGVNRCIPEKLINYLKTLLGENDRERLASFADMILEYSSKITDPEKIKILNRVANLTVPNRCRR